MKKSCSLQNKGITANAPRRARERFFDAPQRGLRPIRPNHRRLRDVCPAKPPPDRTARPSHVVQLAKTKTVLMSLEVFQ